MWPKLLDLSREECMKLLRRHELVAYSNLVTAFRAQGTLEVEKKGVLKDVAEHLKISQERHRAEIRRAVNDEKLSTIAYCLTGEDSTDVWAVEGRRLVPVLRRSVPQTLYSVVADDEANKNSIENEKLPFPSQTERKRPLQTTSPESNKNVPFRMPPDTCHKLSQNNSEEIANKKRKTNVTMESSSLAQHLMMGPPKVSKLQQIYRQKSKPNTRLTTPTLKRQNYGVEQQSPAIYPKVRRVEEVKRMQEYLPDMVIPVNPSPVQKQHQVQSQQQDQPQVQQQKIKQQTQQQPKQVHVQKAQAQQQGQTQKMHLQQIQTQKLLDAEQQHCQQQVRGQQQNQQSHAQQVQAITRTQQSQPQTNTQTQHQELISVEIPIATISDQQSKGKTVMVKNVGQPITTTTTVESQARTITLSSSIKLPATTAQTTKTKQPQKVLIVSNTQSTNSSSILQRTLTIPFIKTISMKNLDRVKVINNLKNVQITSGSTTSPTLTTTQSIPKPKLLTVQTKGAAVNKHLNIPFIQSVQLQALQNKGAIKMVPLTSTGKLQSSGKVQGSGAATSTAPVYIMNPSGGTSITNLDSKTSSNIDQSKVEVTGQTQNEQDSKHEHEKICKINENIKVCRVLAQQDGELTDIESQITRLTQIPNSYVQANLVSTTTQDQNDEENILDPEQISRMRTKYVYIQNKETSGTSKKENEEEIELLEHLDSESGTFTLKTTDEYALVSNTESEDVDMEGSYIIDVEFFENNDVHMQ